MAIKAPKTSSLLVAATLLLIVAAMYVARAVLIPVALATLFTFLLSPLDRALRRLGLSRALSVSALALLTFLTVALVTWAITVQVQGFANDLPAYQDNIKKRMADLQIGKGTALDNLRTAAEQLLGDASSATATSPAQPPKPLTVTIQGGRFSSEAWQLVLPLVETVVQIFLVAMLVLFMLLERDELRKRIIRLLGYGRLSTTTQALEDAGDRVSRYLIAQFIVNACLGVAIGLGLFLLGVPYALLCGFLIVILRFIPYVGIWIAALLACAISLATSSNWWQPLSVIALFAVLEPVVGMLVEPLLFSQFAGTSKLAMLIAIAFWTWLWGPVGLLLATPLTACLAVIAKNVPQLEFIAVLFGDEPLMQTSVNYYQKLVALDQDEAEAIVEEHLRTHSVEHVFDEVLIPALQYAKRDSRHGALAPAELDFVYRTTRQIVERIGLPYAHPPTATPALAGPDPDPAPALADADAVPPIRILAWPAQDEGDAIALVMLNQLLDAAHYEMEIIAPGLKLSEVLQHVERARPDLVCAGFLPPGGFSASRHLCKLLRTRRPDLNIVVGHWGLSDKLPADRAAILAAGASHCAATLVETRDLIAQTINPHVKLQPAA